MVTAKIGIRREDKNRWERRVPLPPAHVSRLVGNGLEVVVQPSKVRVFPDQAYRDAGARVGEDLTECPVVFAVKEVPIDLLLPERTYVFFAHVIKGQSHNMPLLRRLLKLRCTLVDYEKITDDHGRRLVFFGRHAGLAGMIDSLWALGQRLATEGFSTPFATIDPTHTYANLAQAKVAVQEVGRRLASEGLPEQLVPLTFGFAGYGNTSQGAQEIFDLLPHTEIAAEDLLGFANRDQHQVFKTVFHERHMAEHRDPDGSFDLQEYYSHPERYCGAFHRYVPELSVLMNCTYWETRYPRLVSKAFLRNQWQGSDSRKLRVIGDVSCDVGGAIECTVMVTAPDQPAYVYQPGSDDTVIGVDGDGPVMLAVDNLPCELPMDASDSFGDSLMPYVRALADADYTRPYAELDLPDSIKRAVITHRGQLTPDYYYLSQHIGP